MLGALDNVWHIIINCLIYNYCVFLLCYLLLLAENPCQIVYVWGCVHTHIFCLFGTEDWAQDLAQARHMIYHWARLPAQSII